MEFFSPCVFHIVMVENLDVYGNFIQKLKEKYDISRVNMTFFFSIFFFYLEK